MPSTPLFPDFGSLALCNQLMLMLIIGSGLLCLGVVATGALRQYRQRHNLAGLPPAPGAFPYAGDQLFTALFISFILCSAAMQLLPGDDAPAKRDFGWTALLLGIASHVGIYLPMLVRYALVHPWQKPSRPWWHYLVAPWIVFCIIYAAILLPEVSGFTSWLIEHTHCPEHQDLVTLFSRGSNMQRLYIAISAVLIAPIAEECCFRGFLYSTLKCWGGCAAAALTSALLFGVIHSSLAQVLPLTIFGIVQCIAYEKSRSLWLPITVHALFNSVSLVATCLIQP